MTRCKLVLFGYLIIVEGQPFTWVILGIIPNMMNRRREHAKIVSYCRTYREQLDALADQRIAKSHPQLSVHTQQDALEAFAIDLGRCSAGLGWGLTPHTAGASAHCPNAIFKHMAG